MATPAVVVTTDFFTPVVDDPYDWGRIAAANALSDVYAMGGRPLVALNLVGWPRDVFPMEMLARGASRRARRRPEANCHLAGGHSYRRPGAEVRPGGHRVGAADAVCSATMPRGRAEPITLTKPLGLGVLEQPAQGRPAKPSRHAIATMTTLNPDAARGGSLTAAPDARPT